DPAASRVQPGAVDPDTAPHPATQDELYRKGEALFHEGKYAEARAAFNDGLLRASSRHPNYAYYIACCWAREGKRRDAAGWLAIAGRDGWKDFDLLPRDDDLAALRGDPAYEAIKARGVRTITLDDIPTGKVIEIDMPQPMGILAIGAF